MTETSLAEALVVAVNAYLAHKSNENREALICVYDQFCYWAAASHACANRPDTELLEAIGILVASLRSKRALH